MAKNMVTQLQLRQAERQKVLQQRISNASSRIAGTITRGKAYRAATQQFRSDSKKIQASVNSWIEKINKGQVSSLSVIPANLRQYMDISASQLTEINQYTHQNKMIDVEKAALKRANRLVDGGYDSSYMIFVKPKKNSTQYERAAISLTKNYIEQIRKSESAYKDRKKYLTLISKKQIPNVVIRGSLIYDRDKNKSISLTAAANKYNLSNIQKKMQTGETLVYDKNYKITGVRSKLLQQSIQVKGNNFKNYNVSLNKKAYTEVKRQLPKGESIIKDANYNIKGIQSKALGRVVTIKDNYFKKYYEDIDKKYGAQTKKEVEKKKDTKKYGGKYTSMVELYNAGVDWVKNALVNSIKQRDVIKTKSLEYAINKLSQQFGKKNKLTSKEKKILESKAFKAALKIRSIAKLAQTPAKLRVEAANIASYVVPVLGPTRFFVEMSMDLAAFSEREKFRIADKAKKSGIINTMQSLPLSYLNRMWGYVYNPENIKAVKENKIFLENENKQLEIQKKSGFYDTKEINRAITENTKNIKELSNMMIMTKITTYADSAIKVADSAFKLFLARNLLRNFKNFKSTTTSYNKAKKNLVSEVKKSQKIARITDPTIVTKNYKVKSKDVEPYIKALKGQRHIKNFNVKRLELANKNIQAGFSKYLKRVPYIQKIILKNKQVIYRVAHKNKIIYENFITFPVRNLMTKKISYVTVSSVGDKSIFAFKTPLHAIRYGGGKSISLSSIKNKIIQVARINTKGLKSTYLAKVSKLKKGGESIDVRKVGKHQTEKTIEKVFESAAPASKAKYVDVKFYHKGIGKNIKFTVGRAKVQSVVVDTSKYSELFKAHSKHLKQIKNNVVKISIKQNMARIAKAKKAGKVRVTIDKNIKKILDISEASRGKSVTMKVSKLYQAKEDLKFVQEVRLAVPSKIKISTKVKMKAPKSNIGKEAVKTFNRIILSTKSKDTSQLFLKIIKSKSVQKYTLSTINKMMVVDEKLLSKIQIIDSKTDTKIKNININIGDSYSLIPIIISPKINISRIANEINKTLPLPKRKVENYVKNKINNEYKTLYHIFYKTKSGKIARMSKQPVDMERVEDILYFYNLRLRKAKSKNKVIARGVWVPKSKRSSTEFDRIVPKKYISRLKALRRKAKKKVVRRKPVKKRRVKRKVVKKKRVKKKKRKR